MKYFTVKEIADLLSTKHARRYNSTAKLSLAFLSPNKAVSEYFSQKKCNICLDT